MKKKETIRNVFLWLFCTLCVSTVVFWLSWWEWVENASNWESLDATVWNSLVNGIVKKTGSIAETITGVKTFSSSPVVPSPTASWEVASKWYVDTKPVFRAYMGSNQSVANGAFVKMILNTENFDSHNRFDTTTNRFTPLRAWYYQINAVTFGQSFNNRYQIILSKNGTWVSSGHSGWITADMWAEVSDIIYFNWSTDYLELTVYHFSTSARTFLAGTTSTFMSWHYIGD